MCRSSIFEQALDFKSTKGSYSTGIREIKPAPKDGSCLVRWRTGQWPSPIPTGRVCEQLTSRDFVNPKDVQVNWVDEKK